MNPASRSQSRSSAPTEHAHGEGDAAGAAVADEHACRISDPNERLVHDSRRRPARSARRNQRSMSFVARIGAGGKQTRKLRQEPCQWSAPVSADTVA